jgi:hypothetical protein
MLRCDANDILFVTVFVLAISAVCGEGQTGQHNGERGNPGCSSIAFMFSLFANR